jgi:flagellar P-ring protein precursor FlgI
MTPLKGPDGRVYALAQGQIVVPATGGNTINQNLNSWYIPDGATLERSLPFTMPKKYIDLYLNYPSFNTANAIQDPINNKFGYGIAVAIDSDTVRAKLPPYNAVDFLSMIGDIRISPVAVASGNISVEVRQAPANPQQANKTTKNGKKYSIFFIKAPTLRQLFSSLNSVVAKPSDIINIIEAMAAQGAIHAKVEVE